jgi:hypothetical protein
MSEPAEDPMRTKVTKLRDEYGNWTCAVPVAGITVTDAVKNEFRIRTVTLVHRDKFPRIRRRLGLRQRISEWRSEMQRVPDFSDILGILRHNGTLNELRTKCLRTVSDELGSIDIST